MNKQELIDKAVHALNGVTPADIKDFVDVSIVAVGGYYLSAGYLILKTKQNEVDCICTKDELQQRARELGYINGYRWGVEYPTNGEQPDLDGDVVVEAESPRFKMGELTPSKLSSWNWAFCTSFRIIDQRYKPADTSYLETPALEPVLQEEGWYDYDNQKAIALPPVGVECEVNSSIGWVECSILAMGSCKDNGSTLFWQAKHDCGAYYSVSKFRPLDHNRKAEAEKKRVVDAAMAMAVDTHMLEDILGSLYDAGYLKLPE
jgi:hypothetical protein